MITYTYVAEASIKFVTSNTRIRKVLETVQTFCFQQMGSQINEIAVYKNRTTGINIDNEIAINLHLAFTENA